MNGTNHVLLLYSPFRSHFAAFTTISITFFMTAVPLLIRMRLTRYDRMEPLVCTPHVRCLPVKLT